MNEIQLLLLFLGAIGMGAGCSNPGPSGEADAGGDTGTGTEDCLVDAPDAMVLDLVASISAPVLNIETIAFESAEPVTLDVGTPIGEVWHDMLQWSMDNDEPTYLRIDPMTRLILDVLRSFDGQVVSFHDDVDYVGVEFTTSAAIHSLFRDSVCFDHILAELEAALADQSNVQISECDEDGIVDIRPPP